MKKMVFCIIPLIMAIMGCASKEKAVTAPAAATKGDASGMDLDTAIKAAAAQMGEHLPGGTKVALVSVASSSAQFSEYVISRLEAALVSGRKLVVVDRANLDKVREEQGFHLSGEVDDDSAKAIGKLLGAGAIVTGAFGNLGDVYSLSLKAINIETATVAVSYPADIAQSTRIETLLANGGGSSAGTGGTRTAQTPQASGNTKTAPAAAAGSLAPPPPAVPVGVIKDSYAIGETGPAGGFIFYDKGNNSGGWQYLEAAPARTEFTAIWNPPGRSVDSSQINNDVAVGKGLDNTKAIVAWFSKLGGGFGSAAWECNDLVVNGFDDWFLPSLGELNYMYGNLHRKGLGGFNGDWYWCSNSNFNQLRGTRGSGINFLNGTQNNDINFSNKYRVRAIRQF